MSKGKQAKFKALIDLACSAIQNGKDQQRIRKSKKRSKSEAAAASPHEAAAVEGVSFHNARPLIFPYLVSLRMEVGTLACLLQLTAAAVP
jgi:hypothetical protein